jgi:hypothetical protein
LEISDYFNQNRTRYTQLCDFAHIAVLNGLKPD